MKYLIAVQILVFLLGSYFICFTKLHDVGFIVCCLGIFLEVIVSGLRYIFYGR